MPQSVPEVTWSLGRAVRALDATVTARILDTLRRTLVTVDAGAVRRRVEQLRQRRSDATADQLISHIIHDSIRRAAAIVAASAGTSIVPGLGTLSAMALGITTDLTVTIQLQAELVLAIAAVRDLTLTSDEQRRAVLLITGLSSSSNLLFRHLGRETAARVGCRVVRKSLARLIPAVGLLASAGGNAIGTYLIGRQADQYFRARA